MSSVDGNANAREINTSLACACTECLDGMIERARGLRPWL